MIRYRAPSDLIVYDGHVIAPYPPCGGCVEVWDQTLGCPECGRELWTGQTSEDEFFAMHPFMFEQCHDPGDEDPMEWRTLPGMPLGGWRLPSHPPIWHCTDACPGCMWCTYRKQGIVPGS